MFLIAAEKSNWILVWAGQTLDVAYAQENYWKGGNKNELVVCIGVDDRNAIQWGHVFSWSESEMLKQSLADEIVRDKNEILNTSQYVQWIENNINQWQRKEFEDFNYIHTPIPWWGNLIIYTVTIIGCIVSGFFVVNNEITNGGRAYWYSNRLNRF